MARSGGMVVYLSGRDYNPALHYRVYPPVHAYLSASLFAPPPPGLARVRVDRYRRALETHNDRIQSRCS
ncbi:hypothetical protein D779_1842 [Imhoffiella purpurea]|uniref:Uncharacterized protein n=1 Tax=Imhoffiella purpurea TaxID=1249627 RepID=W9VC56_9GAMM|nr:hypothetical protein D779_1842 [Imhoffiella purpurea]